MLGGLFLTSSSDPEFQVNRWLLYIVATVIAAFFIVIMGALARSRRGSLTMGMDAMVGKVAVARTGLNPDGTVFIEGAGWNARTTGESIVQGDRVVVTEVDGLTLTVKKPEEGESEDREQPG